MSAMHVKGSVTVTPVGGGVVRVEWDGELVSLEEYVVELHRFQARLLGVLVQHPGGLVVEDLAERIPADIDAPQPWPASYVRKHLDTLRLDQVVTFTVLTQELRARRLWRATDRGRRLLSEYLAKHPMEE